MKVRFADEVSSNQVIYNSNDEAGTLSTINTSQKSLKSISTIEPIFSKSYELNYDFELKNHKLTRIPFDFKYCSDEQLIELNSIDLKSLNKKQRKELRVKNPKFQMSWYLDNNTVKPRDFGYEWYKGYKAYVKSEWNRLGHMAGDKQT